MEKAKLFEEQHPDEKVILFIRRHWVSFLPISFLTILMALLPFVILIAMTQMIPSVLAEAVRPYLILGSSAYLLFICTFFIISWIDYYFDILIVTDERLVHIEQNGLFNRDYSELNLLRVQNVSTKVKGMLHTFYDYGMFKVETAGQIGTGEEDKYHYSDFSMDSVPHPNQVAQTVMKLHDQLVEHRQQGGPTTHGEGEVHPTDTAAPSDNSAEPNPPSPKPADEGQLKEGETVDL